jgi:hypothetical protein
MSIKNKTLVINSLIIILFLYSFSFSISYVYGHKEIKIGNYTLEAGWEEEPPLQNLLNKIVLYVFDENNDPVRNAMSDLSTSVNYGGVSKELNFIPSEEEAGLYVADIIPSQLGTYILNLQGALGTEQNVSNDIQIEDIEDANRITFPVVSRDSASNIDIGKQITPIMNDLSNQIDELKNELNSTREIIQRVSDEDLSLKSDIERTNLLSYIATGLGASAIIFIGFRQRINSTKQ